MIDGELSNNKFLSLLALKPSEEEIQRYLNIGQTLYEIKENKLWKPYAESFSQFFVVPEVAQVVSSARTGQRYMKVYREFILRMGVAPKELHSKAFHILDKIAQDSTKENWEDHYEVVANLAPGDTNMEDTMSCPHNNIKEIPMKWKCLDCSLTDNKPLK